MIFWRFRLRAETLFFLVMAGLASSSLESSRVRFCGFLALLSLSLSSSLSLLLSLLSSFSSLSLLFSFSSASSSSLSLLSSFSSSSSSSPSSSNTAMSNRRTLLSCEQVAKNFRSNVHYVSFSLFPHLHPLHREVVVHSDHTQETVRNDLYHAQNSVLTSGTNGVLVDFQHAVDALGMTRYAIGNVHLLVPLQNVHASLLSSRADVLAVLHHAARQYLILAIVRLVQQVTVLHTDYRQ